MVKDEGVICNITVKKKNSIAPKGALPLSSTTPYSKTSFASTQLPAAKKSQRIKTAIPKPQNLLNSGFGTSFGNRIKPKGAT